MLSSYFYKILLTMKKIKNCKLIIVGDFNQLPPINDVKNYNYKESHILKELSDYNLLNMTKWRRGDNSMQNITFNNINNICKSDFDNNLCDFNIVWTNKKRLEINEILMKEKYKKAKTKNYIKVKKLEYDDNSQDCILLQNTPIISKTNNTNLNLINNERYIIKKVNIDDNIIVIKNDRNTITINANEFNKLFRVAYACTSYSVQGMSIDKPYTIHQFNIMDEHHKYVCLSRSTTLDNINIF